MLAAVLERPGQPLVVVDDLDVDDPAPGQVRVAVTHCGLCASDLHVMDGSFPSPLPIVLGHEAAGVVEALGEGVTSLEPGDHVVLTPAPPCGRCPWCLRGEHSLCVNTSAIGTGAFPDGHTGLSRGGHTVYRGLGVGAFAARALVPETGAVRIPPEVPLDVACVVGCAVQTGVGAVLNTARVPAGAAVLVLGLGGVGMSVVQGARLAGAARVIAADPVAERREAASALGATHVLDPSADDVVARTHELTGIGADFAFDAVGRGSVVETAILAARPGGTIVCVGAPPLDDAITIAPAVLFTATEKKLLGCLLGSCNSLRDIPRIVELWQASRIDLEALVTARRPLAEVDAAVEDLVAGRGIRTVLEIAP